MHKLTNSGDGGQEGRDGDNPKPNPWAGTINYVKAKFHKHKTERETENRVDQAARITATATRWIAVFTIVLAGVSYCQLRELHSSGEQTDKLIALYTKQEGHTDKLAKAAKAQADAAKTTADSTKDIADRALVQATATNDLAVQAKRQADAANAALKASIESANQDRRPWVGLQLLQCNNCRMETDGSLVIGDLSAVLVNTGKTPAIDMIVNSALKTARTSDPIPVYDDIERDTKASEEKAFSVPPNMPPDIAADIVKTLEIEKRKMMPSKEVLAPNATRGIEIIGGFRQGRERMARMEDRIVVYGLGKVTYYDTSRKTQYVTLFCVMNDLGAGFRYCTTGNEMR
jgi:hypothetical protein